MINSFYDSFIGTYQEFPRISQNFHTQILIIILYNIRRYRYPKLQMSKILSENYDSFLKLVVIGDSSVGKTNLLSRFMSDQFTLESKPTIGVEFVSKTFQVEGQKVKVHIWDTAGQERFRSITQAYYTGASGALIVFDLTRETTYRNIPMWINDLKEKTDQQLNCVLIGNKCDLLETRAVKREEASIFAHEQKMIYLETSAMTSDNVETAFLAVINQLVKQQAKKKKSPSKKLMIKEELKNPVNRVQITPNPTSSSKKKKCC